VGTGVMRLRRKLTAYAPGWWLRRGSARSAHRCDGSCGGNQRRTLGSQVLQAFPVHRMSSRLGSFPTRSLTDLDVPDSGIRLLNSAGWLSQRARQPSTCPFFRPATSIEPLENARFSCTSLVEAPETWQDQRITSSARSRRVGEIVIPSACAVLRLRMGAFA